MTPAKSTCVICSAPSNYAHLGIDACRSCADFYKRVNASSKRVVCRRGDGKCAISAKDPRNCRKCRLIKCERLGMSLSSIKSCIPCLEDPPAQVPELIPTLVQDNIIDTIAREYAGSLKRRKTCELLLRHVSLEKHVRVDFEDEDLLLCSWDFAIDCGKMWAGDLMQLAKDCFPEYRELQLQEQRAMLRAFYSTAYIMEIHYHSMTTFKTHGGPLCMATLTTCFDKDNYFFFLKDNLPTSAQNDLRECMLHYCSTGHDPISVILYRLRPSETEYAALLALAIWHCASSLSEHIVEAGERLRARILHDLQAYYQRTMSPEESAVRLGNMISLEHAFQECNNLFEEELQTYHLSGMMGADLPFLQTVLQIPL